MTELFNKDLVPKKTWKNIFEDDERGINIPGGDVLISPKIINMPAPSNDSDLATKKYVDDAIAGVGGGGGVTPVTFVVAASDSEDTSRADYVCDGTNDESEINQAISDLPAGGGCVALLEGTYVINASISISSNVSLIGNGFSTIIRVKNSKNADLEMIVNSDTFNGNENIIIDNMTLEGNSAQQSSGTYYGIKFYNVYNALGVTSTNFGCRIKNCLIKNFRGYGIQLQHCGNSIVTKNFCISNKITLSSIGIGIWLYNGTQGNIVSENICKDNYSGIKISTGYSSIIGNTCNSNNKYGIEALSFTHGNIAGNYCGRNTKNGIFLSECHYNGVIDNVCWDNTENGIYIEFSDSNTITGNTCSANNNSGIDVINSGHNTMTGNSCAYNDYYGIVVTRARYSVISSNSIYYNDKHGISIYDTCDNVISSNMVYDNNRENSNYDGINLNVDCDRNNIQINTIRKGSYQRYGIRVDDANCNDNFVTNNDLKGAGNTADLSDNGTGTITTAGNRT